MLLAKFPQMTSEDNPEVPTLEEFILLETRVWQALVDGDAKADAALLLPEFLGVYPSGFSDKAGHVGQLAEGPTVARFDLSEARILVLGSEHVMLSYRARFARVGAEEEDMFVSSLWVSQREGWRNIFSQDTPAAQ